MIYQLHDREFVPADAGLPPFRVGSRIYYRSGRFGGTVTRLRYDLPQGVWVGHTDTSSWFTEGEIDSGSGTIGRLGREDSTRCFYE